MVAEIFSGFTAFNSMFSTAKAIKDMNDAVVRNTAVADLWEQILAAQSRYAAAVEEIRALETKVAKFEQWETDKKRYELVELASGVRVYRTKSGVSADSAPHEICPTCYAERHIGLLQRQSWNPGRCQVLVCNDCGSVIYMSGSPDPAHKSYRPTPLSAS